MKNASPILQFLNVIGTIRPYRNGDTVDFVWRYWNPLSYVIIFCLMVATFVLYGANGIWESIDAYGFTVDPYYKENNIDIEWIK